MVAKKEQIGGFDKWEVENAYRTLVEAREILNDEKKTAAVKIYAKKAQEAAAEVSAELKLEKTVSKKMKRMFEK